MDRLRGSSHLWTEALLDSLAPERTQTRDTRLWCDRLVPASQVRATGHTGRGHLARGGSQLPLREGVRRVRTSSAAPQRPLSAKRVCRHTSTQERGCCTTKHNTSTRTPFFLSSFPPFPLSSDRRAPHTKRSAV